MSWFDAGNTAINSTTPQPTAAPSTSTLIAEIDSTQLGTAGWNADGRHDANYQVFFTIGASTTAIWQLEHATSTALGTFVDQFYVQTPTGQSGVYPFKMRLRQNSRIRARLFSTAANAVAAIQAEPLT